MATTSTFTATLNNYSSSGWWENSGTTGQGDWGYGVRTGVMYFAGLTALKSKVINSVQIAVTSSASGYNASKTAYFYESASQGGIDTSLNANHKTGSSFTSVTDTMYNNTKTFTVSAFIAKINAGQDTFCIYATGGTNYLKWSKVVLTVVWQEPTSSFTSASTMAMNSAYTVTISNENTSYSHTVRMTCETDSQTFYTKTSSRTPSITPKLDFASQVTGDTSIIATLYVDTYDGSTLIGTASKTITLTVPTSVKPSISSITKTMVNGFNNQYIQGKSSVTLAINASGSYGSTISKYAIACADLGFSKSTQTSTTNTLTSSGTFTFTATVTDTRGRTATLTTTITVVAYKAPTLSNTSYAQRISEDSETIKIKGVSTWYDVTGNSLTMTYSVDSGTAVALTNSTEITLTGFSLEQTYSVVIYVKDSITTTAISKSFTISSQEWIVDLLGTGNGIAIGKTAELENTFECEWDAQFNNNVKIGEIADVESSINALIADVDIMPQNLQNGYLSSGTYNFTIEKNKNYLLLTYHSNASGVSLAVISTLQTKSYAHAYFIVDSGGTTVSSTSLTSLTVTTTAASTVTLLEL